MKTNMTPESLGIALAQAMGEDWYHWHPDDREFILKLFKEFQKQTRIAAISKAWGAPSKQEALKRLEAEDKA